MLVHLLDINDHHHIDKHLYQMFDHCKRFLMMVVVVVVVLAEVVVDWGMSDRMDKERFRSWLCDIDRCLEE